MKLSKVESVLPAMRAAVYVRLSKEDVSGKRLGIESTKVQHRDAREAIAREGWALDDRHVFTDDGLSGTRANRDGWQAMLAAAKRHEVDVIVVRDLDRFSRLDTVQTLAIIRDLLDAGVSLWSYRERAFIRVDGDAVVLTAMKARQAAAEAEKASERISAGLHARARDGRAIGRAPFGYRNLKVTDQDVRDGSKHPPGKWLVKHEPDLEIVRHVLAVFLETESLSATSRRLNEDGTRPPKGKKWAHISMVKALLHQPLYRGYRMHGGSTRVEHPDLRAFSVEEVRRLEAALSRASKNRPWAQAQAEGKAGFNLAVSFVACGVCERPIVATGSGTKRMYVCDSHRLGSCRGIGYRSAARVDEALVRAVDATLTPEAVNAVCALVRHEIESQPTRSKTDRERITAAIASTEKKIRNLTDALGKAEPIAHAHVLAALAEESKLLAAQQAGLARLDGGVVELSASRTVANVKKRARDLRADLAKGGRDAADAIRVVLRGKRLLAHLVTVEGQRGWKLSGAVQGFYVLDQEHHGSDRLLKLAAQPMVRICEVA